jgi:hypothetical protein
MAKMHVFDVTLAEKYGPVESIILSHLCYWIEKNAANQTNYHMDRYWTYNSVTAFKKIFSYLSEKQIRHILNELKKQDAIYINNFNKIGYDRTLWYSVSDEVMKIYNTGKQYEPPEAKNVTPNYPNRQMDFPNMGNSSDQMGINDQTGNWSENDTNFAEMSEIEGVKPISDEFCCPNGQMDVPNMGNPSDQMGINDQTGNWSENDVNNINSTGNEIQKEKISENALPNGQMDVPNMGNPSDLSSKCISRKRKMDLPNPGNPSPEFGKPIPNLNIYKPSNSSTAEKENIIESLKKMFLVLDHRFIFSKDFYETALAIMNKYEFNEDYCRWLYNECLNIKRRGENEPDNIRGLYYTLFNKPEMIELYVSGNTRNIATAELPDIHCPVCETIFESSLSYCPACKMRVPDMNNITDVEHYKHYLTLSNEQKSNYNAEINNILKLLGNSEYEKTRQDIEERYGFVLAVCEEIY